MTTQIKYKNVQQLFLTAVVGQQFIYMLFQREPSQIH